VEEKVYVKPNSQKLTLETLSGSKLVGVVGK